MLNALQPLSNTSISSLQNSNIASNNEFTVRALSLNSSQDLASLSQIHAQLELDGQIRYGSNSLDENQLTARASLVQEQVLPASLARGGVFMAAFHQDTLVGMVSAIPVMGIAKYGNQYFLKPSVEVQDTFVDRHFRQKGIATALFNQLHEEVSNGRVSIPGHDTLPTSIDMFTNGGNQQARRVYAKLGYAGTGMNDGHDWVSTEYAAEKHQDADNGGLKLSNPIYLYMHQNLQDQMFDTQAIFTSHHQNADFAELASSIAATDHFSGTTYSQPSSDIQAGKKNPPKGFVVTLQDSANPQKTIGVAAVSEEYRTWNGGRVAAGVKLIETAAPEGPEAHEQRVQLLNLCLEKAKSAGYSELIVTTEDDNQAIRASCHAAGFPDTGLTIKNGITEDLLQPVHGQNLGSGLYMTKKV